MSDELKRRIAQLEGVATQQADRIRTLETEQRQQATTYVGGDGVERVVIVLPKCVEITTKGVKFYVWHDAKGSLVGDVKPPA